MKTIVLTFVCAVLTLINTTHSQTIGYGSSEEQAVKYFDLHNSLDAIEGIWTRKITDQVKWRDQSISEEPTIREAEVVIIKSDSGILAFTLNPAAKILIPLNKLVMFTKSAIPNRYTFSADLSVIKCGYLRPVSFSVSNGFFELSYSIECHTGNGITYSTIGSVYTNKTTEHWEKIYPQ